MPTNLRVGAVALVNGRGAVRLGDAVEDLQRLAEAAVALAVAVEVRQPAGEVVVRGRQQETTLYTVEW